MAGWIKMPLGLEVGLGPGDFVSDGDPAPLPKKWGGAPSTIFGPCLLLLLLSDFILLYLFSHYLRFMALNNL